ncbi:MAG: zinc-ribbon domain-containing protein [Deltaproteobacteria bacterium]|nr:zinc-ribbon domain-containing protein [Deltaproteobacteria bacterium]
MRCLQCQHENREGAKFCEECGNKLELACPSCGTTLRANAKFCDNCGTRIEGSSGVRRPASQVQPPSLNSQSPASYTPAYLAERIIAEQAAMVARGAPEGERKTITALFADIKGSTALIEELDPEEARDIVDPVLALMMEAVHRYEGYVAQSLGDGIFALFGAPIAHEDHAQRALYAALRMQNEMKQYSDKLRLEKGVPLQMRVGINTGEVVVRSIRTDDLHTDYVPVGHSTNIAARMENLATPGSIIISENTHKLVDGYFDCQSLGVATVKGASEPVPIYEVRGVGPLQTRLQLSAKRGFSQFVGRQGELAQIHRAFLAAKEGHGQIVGVIGEPGVGKSRICHEFKLLSQKHCLVLETFSVSHGMAYPYLPLIDLLKSYFQITPQDDERRRTEKVTGRVLTLDRALEETLPYILALLSPAETSAELREMDSQSIGRRTRDAIKRLLLRESLNQPVLLIFDDLQWVDNETQAFLDVLSDSLATARILLLVNYRPGYQHSWGTRTYYHRVLLDALGRKEAEELLTTLLGDGPGREPIKQFLLEKTEGNPLFIEEIVRALVEQGVLVRDAAGKAPFPVPLLTKPLDEIQLPPTVQGILSARIDRLGAPEKSLLQTLAVIGKRFSLNLVKRIATIPEPELLSLLSRLQAGEFVYEQVAFPESEYTFKHALTQDVAYNSLLTEQRKILHERTAQAIEADCCRENSQQTLEEQCSELAYHYGRSGNVEKAVEYLQRAGEQALRRSARDEASNHFAGALELLRTLPRSPQRINRELQLLIVRGGALITGKGYRVPEVEHIFNEVRELLPQAEESSQLLPVLMGLWRFVIVRGEYQTSHAIAERLRHLTRGLQETEVLLPAHFALGFSAFRLGHFQNARQHLETCVSLRLEKQPQSRFESLVYRVSMGGMDPRVGSLSWLAWVSWYLGYPDRALQRSQEACLLARELELAISEAAANHFAAAVRRLCRDPHAVLEHEEKVIAIATEREAPQWLASGTFLRGWALADLGQYEEGIAIMQQGLAGWRAMGSDQLGQPSIMLADMYRRAGKASEGLRLVNMAMSELQRSGERWWEAELYRIEGELLLVSIETGMEPEAEQCFFKAITTARQQDAKSLELRATMSLCRLWHKQGKSEDARELLTNIYGWLTEGFETGDLQEAKVLLDELVSGVRRPASSVEH